MKLRYRILQQDRGPEPTDAELAPYRDGRRLLYNYQRARDLLHRRPLYRDPKAFLVLLIIVLLAWLVGRVDRERPMPPGPAPEQRP